MTRIKAFLLCAFLTACVVLRAGQPCKTLDEAFAEAKFNPAGKTCFSFAACSDLHVEPPNFEGLPQEIVSDLGEVKTPPRFLLFCGDQITHASICFGTVPSESQRKIAAESLTAFKKSLEPLNPAVKREFILGNHDTYPREAGAGIFKSVFPDFQPYGSFDIEGVHFVRLNGGADGGIDAEQRAWLAKDLKSVPPEKALTIFVHQPPLACLSNERGIKEALLEHLGPRQGETWIISGHEHANKLETFKAPQGLIAQQTVTRACKEHFGGAPGYWIFCVEDGRMKARIFRDFAKGFIIEPQVDFSKAKPVTKPFGDVEKEIVWKILVGDGDEPFRVKCKANDVVSWFGYVNELIYKTPAKNASRIAILGKLGSPKTPKRGEASLSCDGGANWTALSLPSPVNDLYVFETPEAMRGKELQVRIVCPDGQGVFAGLALLK